MVLKLIKKIIPHIPYGFNQPLVKLQNYYLIKQWKKAGKPAPPPHVIKQNIIKHYQQMTKYQVLVETGTYLGEMVNAQKKNFKKIVSIELSEALAKKAQEKFKKNKSILIIQGDSGVQLSDVVKKIQEPIIFWLDGHYSEGITAKGAKECPIFEEIESIFNLGSKIPHVLLIDDARCFKGVGDYPSIENLYSTIKSKNEKYEIEIKDDVIRFTIQSLKVTR